MRSGDDRRFDWRGGGAAAGALLAALVLLGMVFLVAMSNNARDEALDGERHAYDVTLLTRSLDASISRSEAALGPLRPRRAGQDQRQHLLFAVAACRAADLRAGQGAAQRAVAARAAGAACRNCTASAARNSRLPRAPPSTGAAPAERAIIMPPPSRRPGPALRALLSEIADAERVALTERMNETRFFAAQADRLTDYLSWLGRDRRGDGDLPRRGRGPGAAAQRGGAARGRERGRALATCSSRRSPTARAS